MSQINDALKRAQDIQTKATPSTVPPMVPVEAKPGSSGAGWVPPVVILLFLILFAGIYLAVSPGHHELPKAAVEPAPAPVIEPAPAVKPPPAVPAETAPAAPKPAPARLQGIVFDPVRPYAIISGRTVYVGDSVNGQRVTAISPDAVTLAANGQTHQWRVGGQ